MPIWFSRVYNGLIIVREFAYSINITCVYDEMMMMTVQAVILNTCFYQHVSYMWLMNILRYEYVVYREFCFPYIACSVVFRTSVLYCILPEVTLS